MRNTIITQKELETILDLCDDWIKLINFYGITELSYKSILDLRKSLQVADERTMEYAE